MNWLRTFPSPEKLNFLEDENFAKILVKPSGRPLQNFEYGLKLFFEEFLGFFIERLRQKKLIILSLCLEEGGGLIKSLMIDDVSAYRSDFSS